MAVNKKKSSTEAEVDRLIDRDKTKKAAKEPRPQAEAFQGIQQSPEEIQERTDRILSIFDVQDEEGNYLYPDDVVRQFIPLMFVLSGAPLSSTLAPSMLDIMEVFLADVGLDWNASREQLVWACDDYYDRFPLHPELSQQLREVLAT